MTNKIINYKFTTVVLILFFHSIYSLADFSKTFIPSQNEIKSSFSKLDLNNNSELKKFSSEIFEILLKSSKGLKLHINDYSEFEVSNWYKKKNRLVLRFQQWILDQTIQEKVRIEGSNLLVVINNNKIDYVVYTPPESELQNNILSSKNTPLSQPQLSSYLSDPTSQNLFVRTVFTYFPNYIEHWLNDEIKNSSLPNSLAIKIKENLGNKTNKSKSVQFEQIFANNKDLFIHLLKYFNKNQSISLHTGLRPYLEISQLFDTDKNLILPYSDKNLASSILIKDSSDHLVEISTMGPISKERLTEYEIKASTNPHIQVPATLPPNSIYSKVQSSLSQIIEELQNSFNLISFDNKNSPVTAIANHHDSSIFGSALWQNSPINQLWIGRPSNKFQNIATSIDILGHEVFHGVESHLSHLDSVGESGALREHLSDVMGSYLRFKLNKSNEEPILIIGSDVITEEGIEAFQTNFKTTSIPTGLRDFYQPEKSYFKQGLHLSELRKKYPLDNSCLNSEKDFCGVHEQTSIPNQIFARLVRFKVLSGIEPYRETFENVSHLIFDTYAFRLTESSNFNDYRAHLVNECYYKKTEGFFNDKDCEQINIISSSLGL